MLIANLLTLLATLQLATGGDPVAAQQSVGDGPAPAPYPLSWEFELKYLDPRRIEVLLPGRSEPETYWYMVYTVINKSDRTQQFFPQFEVVTDDLQVAEADMGINPLVFAAIKERHKITHPYLVHPTEAIGPLQVGDDNARESVAIWRDVDLTRSPSFKVFVAGLSGENKVVKNPSYDPGKPETVKQVDQQGVEREVPVNSRYFTLRKTLEIDYQLPGSLDQRRRGAPQRLRQRWILR